MLSKAGKFGALKKILKNPEKSVNWMKFWIRKLSYLI